MFFRIQNILKPLLNRFWIDDWKMIFDLKKWFFDRKFRHSKIFQKIINEFGEFWMTSWGQNYVFQAPKHYQNTFGSMFDRKLKNNFWTWKMIFWSKFLTSEDLSKSCFGPIFGDLRNFGALQSLRKWFSVFLSVWIAFYAIRLTYKCEGLTGKRIEVSFWYAGAKTLEKKKKHAL